jgi:hypothetical protein
MEITNTYTNWQIEPSMKYDALCFLNIMTADTFYLTYYKDEYEKFKPKLTPDVTKALSEIKRKVKDENGTIVSAWLCLYCSAVEDSTLAQMVSTLSDLGKMKENFKKTPYYDDESWALFESITPELKIVLKFLVDIKWDEYWKNTILPKVKAKIAEVEAELPKYDVISLNEEFLGYKLPSNLITVYMLYYSQPHGIKITGMRFLTDAAWPFKIVIRTAAHEMMHPPYDIKADSVLRSAIESLGKDEFFKNKVFNHDPSLGYNTIEGLVEEDCVQSLDQLINERLGIAYDARKRWRESDEGIHVLAIALYQIMKEDGYNAKKEVFGDYFLKLIQSGRLANGNIEEYFNMFYKE